MQRRLALAADREQLHQVLVAHRHGRRRRCRDVGRRHHARRQRQVRVQRRHGARVQRARHQRRAAAVRRDKPREHCGAVLGPRQRLKQLGRCRHQRHLARHEAAAALAAALLLVLAVIVRVVFTVFVAVILVVFVRLVAGVHNLVDFVAQRLEDLAGRLRARSGHAALARNVHVVRHRGLNARPPPAPCSRRQLGAEPRVLHRDGGMQSALLRRRGGPAVSRLRHAVRARLRLGRDVRVAAFIIVRVRVRSGRSARAARRRAPRRAARHARPVALRLLLLLLLLLLMLLLCSGARAAAATVRLRRRARSCSALLAVEMNHLHSARAHATQVGVRLSIVDKHDRRHRARLSARRGRACQPRVAVASPAARQHVGQRRGGEVE